MNETLKVIQSRRSIRQYKPEQIADSELQEILSAGLYAPNGMNQQKWHFTVIQNKAILDKMVGTIKENMLKSGMEFLVNMAGNPGYHTFYHAPTVIMVSADESAQFAPLDCAAAAENMALAAEALNIGSCFMTSPGLLFTGENGTELKNELGIPAGYNHVCTVSLGYKTGENPPAPPRNQDVINYVK